ncbi:MAG: OprD family outer membrane porin [Ketobacter sp.]|nr:OprD family outer membrane porin [Ketobacter sp.]
MRTEKVSSLGLLCAYVLCPTAQADDFQAALQNGTVNGNIRAYYNTRDYEAEGATDESAFALGGALRAESAQWYGLKFGLGYYTAQDLGTNDDDPAKVNKRLGSDLEVLGEAYITTTILDSTFTVGRQKINTPFANAGDAFIIPFTFEAASLSNQSLDNFTFELTHINTIKNRNSADFVDVGRWSTGRYGVDPASTAGTTAAGVKFAQNELNLALWYYNYSDLFTTLYGHADYTFASSGSITPFIAAQYVTQSDTGDELLGTVSSDLYGIQGGIKFGSSKLTLAYNSVSEDEDSFNNGAFLTPYSFSTSPIFTNNMLTTLENVDAGEASKLTFNHQWNALAFKASYAVFDYEQAVDRNATDLDITYKLDQWQPGLTVRWRLEVVDGDEDNVEQMNNRFQLQLVY